MSPRKDRHNAGAAACHHENADIDRGTKRQREWRGHTDTETDCKYIMTLRDGWLTTRFSTTGTWIAGSLLFAQCHKPVQCTERGSMGQSDPVSLSNIQRAASLQSAQ